MIRYTLFDTAAGWVGVAYSEHGLCRFVLPQDNQLNVREELLETAGPNWQETDDCPYQTEICDYFDGHKVSLDFPIDWSWATQFQKEVLTAVKNIPYGRAESYGSLAALIGKPQAARAVGGALGKNKVPLVIPCHRVLATGARLGGFSSPNGLKDKQLLLNLEEINYSS